MRISISLSLLLMLTAFGNPTPKGIQLWHAGFMHPDEVMGKTGQVWFGLYETEFGFELRKTKVSVRDSTEGLHDKYVAVNQTSLPIFLIRNMETLTAGPVKTVFFGDHFLSPDDYMVFAKREPSFYGLAASGTKEGELIHNYEITFYNNVIKQSILKRDPMYIEGSPSVIWVGDLDRDGKPDLLLDCRTGYNNSEPTLFLSSKAGENELVKKVASYVSIGC